MAGRAPRTGLVLSGGGSRGAYEAGVLLYIREALPRILGHQVPLDVITGTSVGAINASFLAATAERPERQAQELCTAWRSLRIEDLLSLRTRDLFRAGKLLLGTEPAPPAPGAYRYGGLIDTSGLERFVLRTIPWRGIRRNVLAGRVRSVAVSATHIGTGHTVVFIDSAGAVPAGWSRDPHIRHRIAAVGPRHALASAAIPLLFPAVRIGRSFYVDGGLRQNTPMSPAIRLGADRLLVISLRHLATAEEEARLAPEREVAYPKPLFLAGKALNALLLDKTEYDLDRMGRLNAVLEAGTRAFGDRFTDIINRELVRLRGAPIRTLHAVHIRPSVDIGVIAADFVARSRIELRGRVARRLYHRLASSEATHESDLLSYLLFDGNFASALIDLGYEDAARHAEELARLFSGDAGVEDEGAAAGSAEKI